MDVVGGPTKYLGPTKALFDTVNVPFEFFARVTVVFRTLLDFEK